MSGTERHNEPEQPKVAAERADAEAAAEEQGSAAASRDADAAHSGAAEPELVPAGDSSDEPAGITAPVSAAAVSGAATAAASSKAAAAYRQAADEHVKTLKDFWKDFLVSGIFILAAIVIIFACLAWFAANNRVSATGSSISAKGTRYALMVQDSVTKDGSAGAYHEIANDGDDMVVDADSSFNNTTNGNELYPGASGQFKLKLHPMADDLGDIQVKMALKAYSYSEQSKTSAEIDDAQLNNLLLGHIQFFLGKNGQYYIDPIIVDGDGGRGITIKASLLKKDGNNTDYNFTVYWVWPEHFVNFIARGGSRYDKNLFADSTIDTSEGYGNLLKALNGHKGRYYLADDQSSASDAAAGMDNASFTICSDAYDKADDYIGNSAQYLKVIFTADEVSRQPGA